MNELIKYATIFILMMGSVTAFVVFIMYIRFRRREKNAVQERLRRYTPSTVVNGSREPARELDPNRTVVIYAGAYAGKDVYSFDNWCNLDDYGPKPRWVELDEHIRMLRTRQIQGYVRHTPAGSADAQ